MFCLKLESKRTRWKLKYFLVKWYPTEVCKTEFCLQMNGNNILSLMLYAFFWPWYCIPFWWASDFTSMCSEYKGLCYTEVTLVAYCLKVYFVTYSKFLREGNAFGFVHSQLIFSFCHCKQQMKGCKCTCSEVKLSRLELWKIITKGSDQGSSSLLPSQQQSTT